MMGVQSSTLPRGRDGALVAAAGLAALAGGAVVAASAYYLHPLTLPVALVGAAFVAVAFLRPTWGIGGALLMIPLEAVNVSLPTGAVSASEAALVVVGMAWLMRIALRPETVVHPRVRDLPLLVVLLAVAAGVAIAVDPAPVLRVTALWTIFGFAFYQAQSLTVAEIRGVLIAFAVGAGIVGAMGAVQYLQAGDTTLFAGGAITSERAAAVVADPNYFACLLALGLLPALALMIADVRRHVWLVVPVAAGLAGLFLSLSRGGILGFAAGLLVMLAWRRARRVAFALIGVLVVLTVAGANPLVGSEYVGAVEERLSTISDPTRESRRPEIWAVAVDTAVQHPFTGVGANQFEYVAARRPLVERGSPLENTHNTYLSIAAEVGLIALAAFLAFLGQLASRAARAARSHDPLGRALALGVMAALVAFGVQALTSTQIRVPLLVGAAMLLAGMLTRLADDARGGEPAPGG
jgi:putative inorganic carbon (HCO3(-)) transporter